MHVRRTEEVLMRMTFLSGCGALLAAFASSGCAFFQEADGPPQPAASAVYSGSLADHERVLVVRIPAGTRGPVVVRVVNVACADAHGELLAYKPSPYDDEPEPVTYKPSPYEDDAPVPLPVRPSPYKDARLATPQERP
jgi:hypothetical protein